MLRIVLSVISKVSPYSPAICATHYQLVKYVGLSKCNRIFSQNEETEETLEKFIEQKKKNIVKME